MNNYIYAQNNARNGNMNENNGYQTRLTGREETPAVNTSATGEFALRGRDNQGNIHYELRLQNINSVTSAHLHIAPRGVTGPIVVYLFKLIRPTGGLNGATVRGVIKPDDLVNQLQGATFQRLLQEIQRGNIYVNVHTVQHPNGEIRGQLGRPVQRNGRQEVSGYQQNQY